MRDESYDLLKMFHVKHFGGVSELISCLSEKVLYIKAMEVFYLLETKKQQKKNNKKDVSRETFYRLMR